MKNYSNIILKYLKAQPQTRFKIKQFATLLKIPSNEYPFFRDAIKNLAREGKLYRFKGNSYGLIDQKGEVYGILDMHPNGFAYVHTEAGEKIFISQYNLATACHGDNVGVLIHSKKSAGKNKEGHVSKIISRSKDRFVCTYHNSHSYALAIPAIHHLQTEILIENFNGLAPAEGEYIMTRITEWRKGGERHKGEILSIIGKENVAEFDAIIVSNKHNIPDTFSDATLKQVDGMKFSIPNDLDRRDIRDLNCFTIDPNDAKDYDDAISIEKTEEGHFLLGVHIADVSYYVTESTPLDDDALKRGTSVYFTDHVVHMLPEKLSTVLCSLQEGQDRLAMSILMTIDHNGKCLKYDIFKSLINNKRQFSYTEVQDILDKGKGDFSKELQLMSDLAKRLNKGRKEKGSIDFDLPEPEYVLNDKAVPIEIKLRERTWSHHIVEEFMLLANQSVANFARTRGLNLPFIYRIHEIPEADSIYEWFALMEAFGLKVSLFGMPVTPKKFQKALEKVLKQNESPYIIRLALRTMTKAKYSVKPVGHFGLAFEDYTHFTSPIRRYPDLVVHRLLKLYIKGEYFDPKMKSHLTEIAKKSSATELRAIQAEREYHKIKQMRYISNHLGEVFPGIISGVAPGGFWVELDNIFVEGFVHKDSLPNDFWDFNTKHYQLIGMRTKKAYSLGDHINVRVVKIDIQRARADFELVKDSK